ncbi:MAG TPA: DUF4190 domain-containing protein [Verrucomicrobiae bacterium]|jgi:hypothetical protein|nr:DUF4190 domain-containing protein [Verrucomicrobiae bacterium]
MSEFKFTCPICGQNILCDTVLSGKQLTCPHCNNAIGVPTQFAGDAAFAAGTDAAPPLPDTVPVIAQKTSALAVASLVCSLLSLVTCVGWLPGIICGHLAKSRIRRNPALKGNGLASAGLAIGYLILLLEVASAGIWVMRFSAAVKQGIHNVQQDLATNNLVVTQNSTTVSNDNDGMETVQSATNSEAQTESTNSQWVADISQVSFPDHLASGKVHGMDFLVRTALFKNGDLRISSANGTSLEIIHGLGGSIEGKSFEIQASADDSSDPRVKMTWTEGGVVQSQTFSKGYGLKLQFGHAKNRMVAAKIYLCFPDDSKSCVAGSFQVRLPKPKQ